MPDPIPFPAGRRATAGRRRGQLDAMNEALGQLRLAHALIWSSNPVSVQRDAAIRGLCTLIEAVEELRDEGPHL